MGCLPGILNPRIHWPCPLDYLELRFLVLWGDSDRWIGAPSDVIVSDQAELETHPRPLTPAPIQTYSQATMSDNRWIPLECNPLVSSRTTSKVWIRLISDV